MTTGEEEVEKKRERMIRLMLGPRNLYVQKVGGREYYRIPIRPPPFFSGKLVDADIFENITGLGLTVIAICYPEELKKPLISVVDNVNDLVFEKAGETEGRISYSSSESLVFTFAHLNINPTDEGFVITGEEEVRGEKGEKIVSKMQLEIEGKEFSKNKVKLRIESETEGRKTIIEREGEAIWDDERNAFILPNTAIYFAEDLLR
jgi:hypothetical protein